MVNTPSQPVLVGIIIPAYNAAHTLPRTLASVAALKKAAVGVIYHCVLIDDGSSDDTPLVVRDFIEQGVVDTYHRNDCNSGVSAARNIGISLCHSTDFITFCDADDEFAATQLRLSDTSAQDFIFFDHALREGSQSQAVTHLDDFVADQQVATNRLATYLEKYLTRPNKYHLFTSCWSKFFSTRIVIEHNIRFDPSMKVFEDIRFNFEFLYHAEHIHYQHCLLYVHYRPDLSAFKRSASMGGHCSVIESFSFDRALEPLQRLYARLKPGNIQREVDHCIAAYAVITLVRASMRIKSLATLLLVRQQIVQVFGQASFRRAFIHYSPELAHGNRVLPLLIRLRWMTLGLFYAYRLGIRRYAVKPR